MVDLNLIANILTSVMILVLIVAHVRQYSQMEKQLKYQTNQMKQTFFSEYTKRYQNIILNFPETINREDFKYEKLDDDAKNKTMRYMRVYFDLCSEEFFLFKHGHLDEKVWKEWQSGMAYAFKKPAFKLAWEKIAKDTGYYTEFERFVNSGMNFT